MIMKKLTSNKLSELLGYPVKVSKGEFTIGKPYFYRTSSLSDFKDRVIGKLGALCVPYEYLDHGDTWKPFKGGANVWSQSHYWVKIRIIQ